MDGLIKKKDARVVRGKDWKYDNQDGGGNGSQLGTVSNDYCGVGSDQGSDRVEVKWDNDIDGIKENIYCYRMGAEGKYDLALAKCITGKLYTKPQANYENRYRYYLCTYEFLF